MKMQLCAAQHMNAHVLILNKPTGRLDVDNAKCLEDWLEAFTGSIICISTPPSSTEGTHICDCPKTRRLKTLRGLRASALFSLSRNTKRKS